MSILDTVTPSSWKRTRISNGEVEYFSDRDWKHEALFEWEPQYSQSLLASLTKEHEQRMVEYEEVLTDHRMLVRQLDVLMNGEEGAAAQASLCDIVVMLPAWRDEYRKQVLLELADSLDEKRSNYHFPRISSDELRRMAEGEKE
jgi:hypothetical protein